MANCNFFMCNCDPCYGTLCVAIPPKGAQAVQVVHIYFEDVDADRGGTLSLDETVAYAKAHGKKAMTRDEVKSIFDRLDTNHDGALSQKECGLPSRPVAKAHPTER